MDAWEQAREIRDNIQFPKADPAAGETWSAMEDLTPISDQCKTSAKSAATIQPAVFLLMLIAAKEISLSLVLAFLGLFAGLEIVALLGTIAFPSKQTRSSQNGMADVFWMKSKQLTPTPKSNI